MINNLKNTSLNEINKRRIELNLANVALGFTETIKRLLLSQFYQRERQGSQYCRRVSEIKHDYR